ncbi:MAG: Omp28-related outer membrane protein [Crocinitomicaceae bacterium]|nr:Omp28-related outer membrane protein [Crocinitomicaceae bacterium]
MKKILLPVVALMAFGASAQTHFTEDFNAAGAALTGWTATDVDGDGQNWYGEDFSGYFPELEAGTAISRSWTGQTGALSPNNFLTSGAIDLTSASGTNLFLQFSAGTIEGAPYHAEEYNVYLTTSLDPATIASATAVFNEILPSDGMFSHSVDVSAFAGQTVYLTFRHFNTFDMNTLLIDNISIKNLQDDDAAVAGVSLARYAAVSTNNTLSVEVKNVGGNDITSLEINWNDGTDHIQTINQTITPGSTVSVDHPDAVSAAVAEEKNITVTISQVNGNADADPSNNDGAAKFNTVSSILQKNVVIEEGTGTWCGWCPRGAVAMDYMVATYPTQFIGVAVHNGDPMTVTEYDNGADISGFPGANVDRAILGASVSQAAFETFYNDRKDLVVPAGIDATTSVSGNDVTIDVAATFVTPFAAADYRLAVVMVEDHVTGTTSGYNQANYYAGNGSGAMGGYESLPDPVPAADMVYDHVGRALLGGYDGQAGSVPAVITDGAVANYTFNYTVPATSTFYNMHAVALLIDQSNGEIVNAAQVALSQAGIAEGNSIELNVYPNPATDNLTVAFEAQNDDYTVSITDLSGRVVSTNTYANLSGAQSINVAVDGLNTGNYMLSVSTANASFNKMVSIK